MSFNLELPDVEEVKEKVAEELAVTDERQQTVDETAKQKVEEIMGTDISVFEDRKNLTTAFEEFGADVEQNNTFNEFLLSIARIVNTESVPPSRVLEREERVNDILQYIHENYRQEITLEELSAHFYISKSRLSQIFKDGTGFSVGEYVITYRIKQACTLLSQGVSVQEVSERVGFHNSSHFIRMFKKRTGFPPGKFAKGSQ